MTSHSDDQLWLRNFHPAPGASVRLVCLPHAGGSAAYYFPMARALAPDIDVLAVQYPGRQDRHTEPLITDINVLADRIADRITVRSAASRDDRPLALFGHSMGSLVAFEVADRLQSRGVELTALIVSGRRAPHLHSEEDVHACTDDDLVALLEELGGTASGLLADDELRQMILPTVRGDYRAVATYRRDTPAKLTCPVLAVVGDNDPRARVDDVRGWADHTTAGFDLKVLPGGHFYLEREQAAVLAAIRERVSPRPVTG
ncbi:alpha/beta fold hydrolase [Streptomyces sp. NPDC000410]|uniref:thioesterase II family protein n=1 Tax=Streptomyces sp. NPDC000410 TaxID=3154254 RepID=UPI00332BF469